MDNNVIFKPKASFKKKVGKVSKTVMYFEFSHEDLISNNNDSFLTPDTLNPRSLNEYSSIASEDIDVNIIKTGQISDAIGRFLADENGEIRYNSNGYPIIQILDGSVRLDSCYRSKESYSIMVAFYTDDEALDIISSMTDSQRELSNLELGFHIANLEQKHCKTLNNAELASILPYKKSRQAIIAAKKAHSIYLKYPSLISIFPVISFVGKGTTNTLSKVINFAEKNQLIETLLEFSNSSAFNYNSEDSILSATDLLEFDSQKNKIILSSLSERVGYYEEESKSNKTETIEINEYISMWVEDNNNKKQRTPKHTNFKAELSDEERILAERFLKVLTERKDNKIDLKLHFETFFRRLEM